MKISSPAFEDNEPIPHKYSGEGQNINPPLTFSNIPKETKTLALIVDDPDAPMGTFTHWVCWNIDPNIDSILEGESPGGKQGFNGRGAVGYTGPYPPSGIHHYHFKLYALSKLLDLSENVSKENLEEEIDKYLIDKAETIGTYTRFP